MKRLYESEYCIECGRPASEEHHVLFGRNRKNADDYGLTVSMCRACHSRLHDRDEELAMKYRKLGQLAFEYRYSHEEYMQIFGRSYV